MKSVEIIVKTSTKDEGIRCALKRLKLTDRVRLNDEFEFKSFGYKQFTISVTDEEEGKQVFQLLMHGLASMRVWLTCLNVYITGWAVEGRIGQYKTRYLKIYKWAYYKTDADEWGAPEKHGHSEPYNNYKHTKREHFDIAWL